MFGETQRPQGSTCWSLACKSASGIEPEVWTSLGRKLTDGADPVSGFPSELIPYSSLLYELI
jgi:hypothetical protein